MNLQDTFYIVGIIAFSLYTVLLIVVAVILFIIKKKITDTQKAFQNRIDDAKETAVNVGSAVVDTAISKVSEFIKDKRSKK